MDSEYIIGREHPQYGEGFREEDHIVQDEVSMIAWGWMSGWMTWSIIYYPTLSLAN